VNRGETPSGNADADRDRLGASAASTDPEASVLGSLPRERPGRRSRRREEAARHRRTDDAPPEAPEAPEDTGPSGGGLEDLAWAGIAIAAEAATLGVRVLNRVLEAGTGWPGRSR
jgi:hypothetical protein